MNWLFTWLMLAAVLWLIGWGLLRRERIYQFPFLVGVITFSFILPQIPALAADPFLPHGAYVKTIAFSILCLIMCRIDLLNYGIKIIARCQYLFMVLSNSRRKCILQYGPVI